MTANDTMTAMPPSDGLIARLWRRCRDSARAWIPLVRDVTAEDVKSPQETSAKLAGRWPDAESLLAHRVQALDLNTPKHDAGERKPNNT